LARADHPLEDAEHATPPSGGSIVPTTSPVVG
jgi:hypothetical protein